MRILLFVMLNMGVVGAQIDDYYHYPPSVTPDRIMLNVTTSPATSMAVTWRTAASVDSGFIQISPADPAPDLEENARTLVAQRESYTTNLNGAHYFSAIMSDLQPGTMYAYRVGYGEFWSAWAHFVTADQDASPLSFIYFGDAQNDLKSMWSRSIRGAFQQLPKADFLLHAGDLVNFRNSDREWGEWYEAGGWIYQMIPSIATPGNHEYGEDTSGNYVLSDHWRPTFTLPENGPEGYEETTFYIDYQDTRIISIDAPAFKRSSTDRQAIVNWTKAVLAANPSKWTVVTMHYPIYSTKLGRNNEGLRESLQPLFEEYGVDIVLQGHDHTYGRGTNLPIGSGKNVTIEGPIYVVSVSGPKMYDLGLDDWMQRGASNTQLYQLIHIAGNTLRFEAYTVDSKLYDAFELHKNDNGLNFFFDLAPENVPERLDLPPRWKESYSKQDHKEYQTRFQRYKARLEKQRQQQK